MKEKAVLFCFDIQGTLEMMTSDDISLLFSKMAQIKQIYGANKAIISISTVSRFTDNIQKILNQFEQSLDRDIVVGKCFYLEGEFNALDKFESYKGSRYNYCKEERFISYLEELKQDYDLCWCSYIDDSADISKLECLREKMPFSCLRPGQKENKDDSLICFSTENRNINGVNELLDIYLQLLLQNGCQHLFEQQVAQLPRLSSDKWRELYFQLEIDKIERYLLQGGIEKRKLEMITRDMNMLIGMDEAGLEYYKNYNREKGRIAFNWENITDEQRERMKNIVIIATAQLNNGDDETPIVRKLTIVPQKNS